MKLLTTIIGTGFIITTNGAFSALKQQTQVLQKIKVPESKYEVGMGMAKLSPNEAKGRHMHSGVEVGYVLQGEITMLIDGQPPKTIKAGDSFQYPAYVIHDTKAGPKGAKVIATWVATQGIPISLPAPSF